MGPVLHFRTIRLQWLGFLGLRTVVRGWGSYEPCYHSRTVLSETVRCSQGVV
jgi:hypothetical protein